MTQKTWLGAAVSAVFVVMAFILSPFCYGQQRNVTAPVVMLSDLHFDPFRDPSKLDELRLAKPKDWTAILDRPNAANQPEAFAALQKACKARGIDSSWELLKASLAAAKAAQGSPAFVTISGDLLTHNFDCRMRTLAGNVTPDELEDFAAKSLEFVALRTREAFPGVAVYVALGNNDSGCSDKHESVESKFMQRTLQVFMDGAFNERHHAAVRPVLDSLYDYNVVLPRPIKHGRLIVLQDVFAMPEYKDCDGKADEKPAQTQIAWLREQLTFARARNEHVWVMAHVPPGVDEYANFHKYLASPQKICEAPPLTMMLATDELTATLTEFSDVVRLAIFAHTHMDEMKALRGSKGQIVPAKILPSISPVNGNLPAFTVGVIDTDTSILMDYSVYVASNTEAASWSKSYEYGATYKKPDYSAKSVADLTGRLMADREGSEEASLAYQRLFQSGNVGNFAAGVKALWPTYSCGTIETTETTFRNCMCPSSIAEPK